jgi:RND superfamily putative drug exporter
VVTSAAILFCIAVGALVLAQTVILKEIGLAAALAVLIDSSVVRALLVPSLMAILGRWNWWAPRPLAALHRRLGLYRLEGGEVQAESAPL